MTPRKEINPPVGPDVQRVLTAMSAECASERERAVRWEALARQLGDALANWEDPRRLAPGGSYADAVETAAFDMRAALSVYRDAIKEEEA